MSKGGRSLSDDEKKLWRRVASQVKPRRGRRVEPEPSPPIEAGATPVRATSSKSVNPPPQSLAPPQDRRGEKRVRRGKLEIGATLDLHGHNQDTARAALVRFLSAASARGDRTVIVVTGVGRAGQGVLKRRLPEWLADPALRAVTSGYAQAHRSHGGEGAFYVFLRRAGSR